MSTDLRKSVNLGLAFALVVGSVIGSGIFMKPGRVIGLSGDSSYAILAWAIGGLITIASGLTMVEIATQIPRTGGLYVYIEELFGEVLGFISGWVQALVYGPAVIGGLAYYFGSLAAPLLGWELDQGRNLGIATIVFLAAINALGTQYGGFVQIASTIGKFVPIILIGVFGLWQGEELIFGMPSGLGPESVNFGAAILATLWAYDGWMLVCFVAGEMKNPQKILPAAIIGGILVVTVTYLVVNLALLRVLPAAEIVRLGEGAGPAAAKVLFGEHGAYLVAIGIAVSIFGCLNGKILGLPRVAYAMAERQHLPFSHVWITLTGKAKSPVNASLLQCGLAIVLMLYFDPNYLTDMSVFVIEIFFLLSFIGVFILRRRQPLAQRTYSVPLFPLVPALAIMGTLYILIETCRARPLDCALAVAASCVGLPFFLLIRRRQAKVKVLKSPTGLDF